MQCPMIVRWLNRIAPGSETNLLSAHYDFLATLADIVGVTPPQGKDSLSYLPTLLGQFQTEVHDYVIVNNHNRHMGSSALITYDGWKLVEIDRHQNHFDWPEYRPVNETDREAIEHVRYEYAADVSLCDEHLGRVLDLMDEFELWEDTMLIVCTDHGFLLSEHDWWGKNRMPLYNEMAHIPLWIWDPRCAKKDEWRQSLVQFIDFAPTLLEYFGLAPTEHMMGCSLAPTVADDTAIRDTALFGVFGGQVNITDGRWVYMRGPVTPDNTPLYQYTLMPTHLPHTFEVEELQDIQLQEPFPFTKGCRTMKIASGPVHQSLQHEFGTLLFDLESDYAQKHPVTDAAAEKRMADLLVREMERLHAPPDQYERLGLR